MSENYWFIAIFLVTASSTMKLYHVDVSSQELSILALHLCLLLPFLHVRTSWSLLNKVSAKEPQVALGNDIPFRYSCGTHLGSLQCFKVFHFEKWNTLKHTS